MAAPLAQIEPFLTRPTIDLILYDFGAVAAIYSVPIEGTFEDLLRLSEELYDNPSFFQTHGSGWSRY